MHKNHLELIAVLLGEAGPSVETKRWLATEDGAREFRAYGETLSALEREYRRVPSIESRQTAYYGEVKTPIGRIFLAATDNGLARIAFGQARSSFIEELARRLRLNLIPSSEKLAGVAEQLEHYFAGKRRSFDVALDLTRATPFQRRVLAAALTVPAGEVISYGELARRIGRPGASRAVGQALGHNPVPIVVPCHRIIQGSGCLGGYTGGLEIKKKLLEIEGVRMRGSTLVRGYAPAREAPSEPGKPGARQHSQCGANIDSLVRIRRA